MTKIEAIKHLKVILPADQFLVTGSTALAYLGLIPEESSGDLDIILYNPTEQALETAKALQKGSPAKTSPTIYPVKSNELGLTGIFELDGVKVDIFCVPTKNMKTLSVESGAFEITSADFIVAAKKSMGRLKDWVQLNFIAKRICGTSEFLTNIEKKGF